MRKTRQDLPFSLESIKNGSPNFDEDSYFVKHKPIIRKQLFCVLATNSTAIKLISLTENQ